MTMTIIIIMTIMMMIVIMTMTIIVIMTMTMVRVPSHVCVNLLTQTLSSFLSSKTSRLQREQIEKGRKIYLSFFLLDYHNNASTSWEEKSNQLDFKFSLNALCKINFSNECLRSCQIRNGSNF